MFNKDGIVVSSPQVSMVLRPRKWRKSKEVAARKFFAPNQLHDQEEQGRGFGEGEEGRASNGRR